MKAKTCINCGAALRSNVCDYCGTEYELDGNCNHTQKGKQINEFIYELDIQGKPYRFYVGDIQVSKVIEVGSVGRGADGKIIRDNFYTKRKLTLIEM